METIEAIEALEATNSKLAKIAILGQIMRSGNMTLIEGFRRCYDTYETFGIKKLPEQTQTYLCDLDMFDRNFHESLDEFAARKITGGIAIQLVKDLMNNCDGKLWSKFYGRVLLKNMKVGVSVTTWNKVAIELNLPHFIVPVFACQLAVDGNKVKNVSGKKLVEVKLDGVRVISIVHPNGVVQMYSRNGKPLNNFPEVAKTLSKYAWEYPHVFDGEIMSSSFQDLMTQVNRKSDVQTNDAVLFLFDALTLEEFVAGRSDIDQTSRSWYLSDQIREEENVKVVGQELVDLDTIDGKERMKAINKKAVLEGYEGIMLKDPDAPYECKRTKSWLKDKPFIEVTLTVVGVEEGTGKYQNDTGALVCEGIDDGVFIKVNVGSGLSDDQRDSIWRQKKEVIGQLVEVRADAITQSSSGEYSLRFPRLKTFRGFEKGEKL